MITFEVKVLNKFDIFEEERSLSSLLLENYSYIKIRKNRMLPPLHILNSLLESGICSDGDDDIEWEPFSINHPEYLEFIAEIKRKYSGKWRVMTKDNDSKTFDDWYMKLFHKKHRGMI